MSFLKTTARLHHTSVLPEGTDPASAVRRLLRDHVFVVNCGPHSVACERVDAEEEARLAALALKSDAKGEHPLPECVRSVLENKTKTTETKTTKTTATTKTTTTITTETMTTTTTELQNCTYRVTDMVHTVAGLMDSRVLSTYEMTDMPNGVFVRIRSPMSIVMDTKWVVATTDDKKDSGEKTGSGSSSPRVELVEDIVIYCSRFLIGTVKGLCEGGWEEIHAKMIEHLGKADTGTGTDADAKAEHVPEPAPVANGTIQDV